MFVRARSGLLSLLLIPVLVSFSFQRSLEIIHPIEEGEDGTQARHQHRTDGPTFDDAAVCGGGIHPSHYCAHSNALTDLGDSAPVFRLAVAQRSAFSIPLSPDVLRTSGIFGRAPPALI
jgi:hypothetical protein